MTDMMADSLARTADRTGFVVRPLALTDWPAAKAVDAAAFGYDQNDDFMDNVSLPAQQIERFTGVFDPALDGLLLGIGAIQPRELTFPGRGASPVAAVTWVAVRPDQQRRGVLRQVMTAQLHGLHRDAGEPVAILTASEAAIYGRFGYGLASSIARLELPTPATLASGTVTEPVREMDLTTALPVMKALHARIRPNRAGFLDRSDAVWAALFSEHPIIQQGRGKRRVALHADGYVVYRIADSSTTRGSDSTLTVIEISASTAVAHASLWRHVLAYPLIKRVIYPLAWLDEPLQDLLANPRAMSWDLADHVWVRLVDLTRAVDVRTYTDTASLVARIVDPFCPWNDGTWELSLTPGGGRATPSTHPADVQLDIADLGAAFLGGTRIARLAAAGRVTGSADHIAALDAALGTALRPFTPEGF